MDQDRVRSFFRLLGTRGSSALDTLQSVFTSTLQRCFSSTNTLDAHAQTLIVHHGEHGGQSLVLLANQPAPGAVEVHHASSGPLDAHFFLEGTAAQAIALAKGAVFVDCKLGHQKQGNPLGALGRIRQLRQHQVDDVLRHVVLAPGNENLGARYTEGAIAIRLGLGADNPQIRARMRFRQVHSA